MAVTQRPQASDPAEVYDNHAAEARAQHGVAFTDDARIHFDHAWSHHITAANMVRHAARQREAAAGHRRNAEAIRRRNPSAAAEEERLAERCENAANIADGKVDGLHQAGLNRYSLGHHTNRQHAAEVLGMTHADVAKIEHGELRERLAVAYVDRHAAAHAALLVPETVGEVVAEKPKASRAQLPSQAE